MATPIGTIGTIPTMSVGGCLFTNLTTIIILHGLTSTNTYGTMRKSNGGSGYAVTAGKTYTINAVALNCASASSVLATLGYGSTDVGINSSSAPSNPVYMMGSSSYLPFAIAFAANGAFLGQNNWPVAFPVIAANYPLMVNPSGAAAYMTAYGYEA